MNGDRIGVFVCSWGSGKDARLDIEALVAYAAGFEGVVLSRRIDRICSVEGQREMISTIEQGEMDRFVAVACSLRTKEALYRSIAAASGLHPLAFESANIREQAAYVHDAMGAQRKARALISMAVEKLRLWSPPPFEARTAASKNVAILGGGLAAIMAARDIISQGLEVVLICPGERFQEPPDYLFKDDGERERALSMIAEVSGHPSVRTYRKARLQTFDGLPGDFGLVLSCDGEEVPVRCGAVVLAPEPRMELRRLDGSPAPTASELSLMGARKVAILPSGASTGVGCSCITPRGILYALSLLGDLPGAEVALFGREVRALGGFEAVQRLAQTKGARFVRVGNEPPILGEGPFLIHCQDPCAGEVSFPVDMVLLDAILTPEAPILAKAFGLPVDEKGELLSLESRLRPGETVRKGVFVARYRVGNMLFEDMLLEAGAAAARAAELVRGTIEIGGAVAEVDQEKCSACLSCVRICPYGAPQIGSSGKAEVQVEICQGCGSCLPLCPSRAIDMYGFSGAQLVAQARAALRREG